MNPVWLGFCFKYSGPLPFTGSKGFRLTYVGMVSRTPTLGSFPICKFLGDTYYLCAGGDGVVTSETFVPAWLIGTTPVATKPEPKALILILIVIVVLIFIFSI